MESTNNSSENTKDAKDQTWVEFISSWLMEGYRDALPALTIIMNLIIFTCALLLGRTDSMIYIGALSLTIKVFAITNAILAMFYCAWVTNRFIKEKKRNRKSKVTTIVKIVHVPVDSGSLEASDSNNPSEAAAAAR